MAQRILRPLSLGDLFDEMFDLYKNNFLLFAGIAGLLYIPIYVLVFSFAAAQEAMFISMLFMLPASYVVLAATTWAVSKCYLGETVTIKDAYKAVASKWLGLLGTMLLAGIFIGLGSMACIVPGVILAFRYAFLSEVYVLEGLSGKDCRVRSAALAQGNVALIFAVNLLAGILTQIISAVLTAPVDYLTGFSAAAATGSAGASVGGVLYGLMQGLALMVAGPLSVIAPILLYYDIRVRREGFDVEMLARNMGGDASPAASETTPVN